MFISKTEKEDLFYRIGVLEQRVNDLTMKVIMLSKFPEAHADKPRKGREWSPEQRAVASERMKKRQAEMKAMKGKL